MIPTRHLITGSHFNTSLPHEFRTQRDDVIRDWTNGPDPDEARELPMRDERIQRRKARAIMDRRWL
jgi:hypothetical protein